MTAMIVCDYEMNDGKKCQTRGALVLGAKMKEAGWLLGEEDTFDFCPEHAKQVIHIYIERSRSEDCWVGPYPTVEDAEVAMENALLIESLCEEDALECCVEIGQYDADKQDVYIIDQTDPHHTGRE